MIPMVRDSKNELLFEKLGELNKIAIEQEAKELAESKASKKAENLPDYYECVKKLAGKYLDVKNGAFEKLDAEEKNLLGNMMLSRARKIKVLIRLSHLIGPSLVALTIYLGVKLGLHSHPGALITACGIVLGALGSIFASMCIEGSPVLKFLKYRKICFPENNGG